jgi:hypothetical protein
VEDRGTWRTIEPSEERGRGMLLIRHLMDSTEFRSDHQRTRAVLRRRVPGGPGRSKERRAAHARS